METPNQELDTLTLQLRESIKYEALKKENERLRNLVSNAFDKGVMVGSRPEMKGASYTAILPIKKEWLEANGL